jgi:hypothetical protein
MRTPGRVANFLKSPRGKFPLGDESLVAPGVHCQLRRTSKWDVRPRKRRAMLGFGAGRKQKG